MTEFDLIERPWIACTDFHGTTRELGLREVLERAHELRGLANESPLVDAALLRLLLAILHHCFRGPEDRQAWMDLRARGALDGAALGRYFAERRDRFDLFHDQHPFYQVPRLIKQSANYERGQKPAREMIAEQSSYGGPRALFESRPSDDFPLPPATAARWLVALQAFHTGGLLTRDATNGDPTSVRAAPLCAVAVVTVRGTSLFDTLVLNLVPYPDSNVFSTDVAEDRPAWDREPQTKFTKRNPRGWLDWLTWQCRRIQLLPDGEGNVGSFLLLAGTELASDRPPEDPMCAYLERNPKLGKLPLGFSDERSIWRDSAALFQIQKDPKLHSARVVSELATRKVRDRRLQLQLYGQVPNKASLVLTATEVVPLPLELIEQPDLVVRVKEELATAESVQPALRGALFVAAQHVLSVGDRKPESKEIGALVESTQAIPRFWAALKPAFDEFLQTLPKDAEAAVSTFRTAMCSEARTAFERAAAQLASPSRALKGLAMGRAKLARELYPLRPEAKKPAPTQREDSP